MPTLTTPITLDLLPGAIELERTEAGLLPHRLPAAARARNDDPQLAMAEAQPSGISLRLGTQATLIELDVLPTKRSYAGMPPRPDGVYDLRIDGRLVGQHTAPGGKVLRLDLASGAARLEPGPIQTLRFSDLPAGEKTVEIYLPHDETTELVALRSDAPLAPLRSTRRRWLHHGSSVSQGSNAASPTGIWPVMAADRADVDLVNMGFGGSALLDPFVARAMRDIPADLISVKIGINLVNTDLMRMRAFGPALDGFLDTIREGHPETPLLVVSPVYCPIHETTPGPSMPDPEAFAQGRLSFRASGDPDDVRRGRLALVPIRERMRALIERRARDDRNIHYLDGTALYGAQDNARLPLPDQLHPDAATHAVIGTRFAQLAFADGPFGR